MSVALCNVFSEAFRDTKNVGHLYIFKSAAKQPQTIVSIITVPIRYEAFYLLWYYLGTLDEMLLHQYLTIMDK